MTLTGEQIGIFVGCCIFLIPAIYFIQKLSGKPENRNITPQPLQVTAVPEFMTTAQCRQLHEQQKTDFQLMIQVATGQFKSVVHEELRRTEETHASRTEELRLEIKKDIGGVHEKINACSVAIGELRGELKEGSHE